VAGVFGQARRVGLRGPGRGKHQPVLERVPGREGQVALAQRGQVCARVGLRAARVQVVGKLPVAAADHRRQQVVAAGVVPVRRLVRHAQAARHLAQAQAFHAVLGDEAVRGAHAGLLEIGRGLGARGFAHRRGAGGAGRALWRAPSSAAHGLMLTLSTVVA
jgi:hypothetical protein